MTAVILLALLLAALPAVLYLRNVREFRPPPLPADCPTREPVSVLIPARNEEAGIKATLAAVLANQGVNFEVVVLNDDSEDRTAELVQEVAASDQRVRLENSRPVPPHWCGKQHACHELSHLANYDTYVFLDADVRLAPDALVRMAGFLRSSGAGLVSGFPRQETGTVLEKLVIPLINWLLLCYLPMARMRRSLQPGLGAGCGQLFVTSRQAYDKVGGHSAIRTSLHDGVTLPRAYRKSGLATDVCDATDLATCRMYSSGRELWNGLAKNAREGLGAWPLILLWTLLLMGGHVLPFGLLLALTDLEGWQIGVTLTAVSLSILPRIDAARRFRASFLGAVMHPVGVAVLISIQWYSTAWALLGMPVGWKGRPHPTR